MPVVRHAALQPPVHMVKLTERREITAHRWTYPDDDDRG